MDQKHFTQELSDLAARHRKRATRLPGHRGQAQNDGKTPAQPTDGDSAKGGATGTWCPAAAGELCSTASSARRMALCFALAAPLGAQGWPAWLHHAFPQ